MLKGARQALSHEHKRTMPRSAAKDVGHHDRGRNCTCGLGAGDLDDRLALDDDPKTTLREAFGLGRRQVSPARFAHDVGVEFGQPPHERGLIPHHLVEVLLELFANLLQE